MREPDLRDDFAGYAGTLREIAEVSANARLMDGQTNPDIDLQLRAIADALDEYAGAFGEGYPNAMQGIALARLIRDFDPNGTATTTVRKAASSDALPGGYISAQVAELSEPTRTPFTCGIAPDGATSS